MDELKELITMVSNLPSLTVWVLAGYLLYRLVVIGSIYGVIRLLIDRIHDWATRPRVVHLQLGSKRCIDEQVAEALQQQVLRIPTTSYIHHSDVMKLRDAIDAMRSKQ